MLVLSRYPHPGRDSILIGDDIRITIEEVRSGSQVRVGIQAPQSVRVLREELATTKPQQENDRGSTDINDPRR